MMKILITILISIMLIGCRTTETKQISVSEDLDLKAINEISKDPNSEFKNKKFSKEKYQKFLNKELKDIEKYLAGRTDLHPILRACYVKQVHAFLEYHTFKDAGLLYTRENQEVIWKITDKGLMILFYKYTVVFKWGECLEQKLQEQWKDVKVTYK